MPRLILLIPFLLFLPGNCQQIGIVALPYQTPDHCEGNQFYDISHLKCVDCGNGTRATRDRLDCQCLAGYRIISKQGPLAITCQRCNSGLAVSPDGLLCVQCRDAANRNVTADSTTGHCQSCDSPDDDIFVTRQADGRPTGFQQCATCVAGTVPDSHNNYCIPCEIRDKSCSCEGGTCNDTAGSTVDSLQYSVTTDDGSHRIRSTLLQTHLHSARDSCSQRDPRACEFLANLCVLVHYDRSPSTACSYFEELSNREFWKEGMPWLYYPVDIASEITKEYAIPVEYTFTTGNPNSFFDLVSARYSLNGTYLGIHSIKGGELQLCVNSDTIQDGAFVFGRKYRQICRISTNHLQKNHATPIFHDLYLRFRNAQGVQQLYPIPLINANLRNGDKRVNELSRTQMNQWIATRRLYLVDNVLHRNTRDNSSAFISYAKYIGINVELQTSRNGKIYVPFVILRYEEAEIGQANDTNHEITFEISYSTNGERHRRELEIAMAVICPLAGIWAIIRVYSWGRRAGKMVVDMSTIVKLLLFACENLSDAFLLVIASMALWITIAYKLQHVVYYMMLSEEQETSFMAYMISAFALKLFAVLHVHVSLILNETFFIDWERPRSLILTEDNPARAPTADIAKHAKPSPVVIWRTYHIANKWNQLHKLRKTSLGLQVIITLLLLEWYNLRAWAVVQPDTQPSEYRSTRLSRFAITLVVYLAVALLQWLLHVVIVERVQQPFHNFLDLCSTANISVLSLTHSFYGYYIHGRSVLGNADTDMTEMNRMLQREKDNLCGRRGLEPGSDLQCYIVNVPRAFRDRYEALKSNANHVPQNQSTSDAITAKVETTTAIYHAINRFLIEFISHSLPDLKYITREITWLETVMDLDMTDTTQVATFSRDRSETAFTGLFAYSHEWLHVSFEVLTFCYMDICTGSLILAAAITYILSTSLHIVSNVFYMNNVVKTSCLDARFVQ